MLHEIGKHTFHNEYYNRKLTENDLYIIVKNGMVLVRKENDQYILPSVKSEGFLESQYLFKIDDVGFYLCEQELDGYEYIPQKQFRYFADAPLRYGIIEGIYLANWYHNNKYCGRCGKLMYHDKKERMLRCDCGNLVFPKICPVAIVGVIKDNTMLLTKYADANRFARYALVAGFCEFGETIEQTVIREVKEETGLNIKNLKYYGSQPWPFSDSLIFGFFAELAGEDHISFTDHELSVAEWKTPEEMPVENELASITYKMMDEFRLKGRKVLD